MPGPVGGVRAAVSLPLSWRQVRPRRQRRLGTAARAAHAAAGAREPADIGHRGRAVSRHAASLADWLDNRTGFRALRRHLLDEPLPAGTAWWFTLGSVLLFGLGVQVVTGIALALYYAPTPDHAYDSVRYITTTVRGGAFVRGLHHWGASIVVVTAVVHLIR